MHKSEQLQFEFAGEQLTALADKALWWPARDMLLIADPHLGKAATFRAVGVGVPDTTRRDLERLSALLRETAAKHLCILGDLLHAKSGRVEAVFSEMSRWRDSHAAVRVILVRGNHDIRAADPPAELRIDAAGGPIQVGSLSLAHDSEELGRAKGIAGHVHPAICMRDDARHTVRLPCFHISRQCILLPAFGSFTGMYTLPVKSDQRAIVAAGGHLAMVTGRP